MEIWKTTEALKGCYEVSNEGRIRRTAPPRRGNRTFVGKILKNQTIGRSPYRYFAVSINGRTTPVHRLVCEAFHGPAPEGCEVSHKNNDKLDNRSRNLEWATHKKNSHNSVRTFVVGAKRGWIKRRLLK